jgi:hypothetical protein
MSAAASSSSSESVVDFKTEILNLLDCTGSIDNSQRLCEERGWDHEAFVGALKSLQSKEMVDAEQSKADVLRLTADGTAFIQDGSHEYRVYCAVPAEQGIFKNELQVCRVLVASMAQQHHQRRRRRRRRRRRF